ncbi:MAG: hypothetical protein GYA33_10210 [Thermogutta sp.]|nr:hypothetical protein [Thermogutta sp.]
MFRTATQAALLTAITLFGASPSASAQKVVVPFDFESKFDQGRYGQIVGDLLWQKLKREGGFIIPEAMADVRDFCEMNALRISPDTPLERMAKIVREDFQADIAIWGAVERAPGASGEIYDLVIKCVDFSDAQNPRVIYDKSARTNSVSEIPHLYVQEMLNALYERPASGPRPVDPIAEENWSKNPNLILGGDFERAVGGVPVGWEPTAGQDRQPLGRLVAWAVDSADPDNHVIRFTFGADVGDTTGVMYYSLPFQVQEGATYRFQCRWRTTGPSPKVFIKCYDEMPSEYARAGSATASPGERRNPTAPAPRATPSRSPSRTAPRSGSASAIDWDRMRECYRSQQNLKGPANTWNVHTEDFTPRHTQYTPQWGRVMLYAYLGAGTVEFDDVVIKQIIPPSPGEGKKDPRRSMESNVTIREMEEAERGSREGQGESPQK